MRRFSSYATTSALVGSSVSGVAAATVSVCCAPAIKATRFFTTRNSLRSSNLIGSSLRTWVRAGSENLQPKEQYSFSTRRFFSSTSTRRQAAWRDEPLKEKSKKPTNPCKVLGVKSSASEAEIKKAYRTLAMKNHPDRGGDPDRFMQIREAYDLVKDGNYVPPASSSASVAGGVDRNTGRPHSDWDHFYYKDGHSGDVLSADKVKDMLKKGKSFSWNMDDQVPKTQTTASGRSTARTNILAEKYDAWYRLLIIWTGFLVTARIGLFAMFPPNLKFMPKHAHLSEEEKAAIQARQKRKLAPPRPLQKKATPPPSAAQLFGRPVVA